MEVIINYIENFLGVSFGEYLILLILSLMIVLAYGMLKLADWIGQYENWTLKFITGLVLGIAFSLLVEIIISYGLNVIAFYTFDWVINLIPYVSAFGGPFAFIVLISVCTDFKPKSVFVILASIYVLFSFFMWSLTMTVIDTIGTEVIVTMGIRLLISVGGAIYAYSRKEEFVDEINVSGMNY